MPERNFGSEEKFTESPSPVDEFQVADGTYEVLDRRTGALVDIGFGEEEP